MSIRVSAFYKFVRLDDAAALRVRFHEAMTTRAMRGTILLAGEGINGTISGTPEAMEGFFGMLRADPRFAGLVTKDATTDAHPFQRLKVKLKREILTLRRPEADPVVRTGRRVAPADWNTLLRAGDVTLIDTRNAYEVAAGTFDGAIDPKTRRFGDFPDYVARHLDPARDKKIAMFCTGGIRCEKASAYLLAHGFETVYQLDGGILNYLAHVPERDSLWRGACFVFDERETVGSDDALAGAGEACQGSSTCDENDDG